MTAVARFLEHGDVLYDDKTGKVRTYLRSARCGLFAGAQIWSVENCVAHSGTPVPWDTSRVWPWVVHVDVVVPERTTGQPIKVTFAVPAQSGPGTEAWDRAELAAIKRAAVHEVLESFGLDPHANGGDTPLWSIAVEARRAAQLARAEAAQMRVLVSLDMRPPAARAEEKALELLAVFEHPDRPWQSSLGGTNVNDLAELLRTMLQSRHALARVRRMLHDGEAGVDDYLAEVLGDDPATCAASGEVVR